MNFAPVGRCIYCGSDGGSDGLSDEHIIAYALGGKAILPKASCETCRKATARDEHYCARTIYGPLRIHQKIQTRNPKERPTHLPASFDYGDRKELRSVPVEHHPSVTLVPAFTTPGILVGKAPSETWEGLTKLHSWQRVNNVREYVTREGASGVEVSGNIKPAPLARMLAKIAHAYAVARFGTSAFRPLLPDLILLRHPHAPYLVGGDIECEEASNFTHEIELKNYRVGNKVFVLARVRLFANVGLPTYFVVVGERRLIGFLASKVRASFKSVLLRFTSKSTDQFGGAPKPYQR